ncbi:MAG TPA: hypothetical protein VJH89_00975 [Patescibacteria group bacterium]|nr:hypothetical protein [Patescibacteria group bacterium]
MAVPGEHIYSEALSRRRENALIDRTGEHEFMQGISDEHNAEQKRILNA